MIPFHGGHVLRAAALAALLPCLAHAEAPTSQDPAAHLNYASVMFYKGVGLLQAGKADESRAVFQAVEAELRLAMELSEPKRAEPDTRLLRSQCAFLLGEVTLNVLNDRDAAKAHYEEALREYPEHDGALRALAGLVFSLDQLSKPQP